MRRSSIIIVAIVLVLLIIIFIGIPRGGKIPDNVSQALKKGEQFELLSLSPERQRERPRTISTSGSASRLFPVPPAGPAVPFALTWPGAPPKMGPGLGLLP